MTTVEVKARDAIVQWSRSLFERGFTAGSSGNISVRVDGGYLCTPTNSCLGFLAPDRLSRLDEDGRHIDGDKPTKELPLHLAFYRNRPTANAVVHLHSTYATAISCLSTADRGDAIAPITPYVVMRVGAVPILPYFKPGSSDMVPELERIAPRHKAVLLANHGPVVTGSSLESAVFAAEELEETAKLLILTQGMAVNRLSSENIRELEANFNLG